MYGIVCETGSAREVLPSRHLNESIHHVDLTADLDSSHELDPEM